MNILIKYSTRLLWVTMLMTAVSSCKKSFLEIEPKGKLIAGKLTDYQQLLYNAPVSGDYASGANMDAQVSLGDEIAAVDPFFKDASFGGYFGYDALRMQRLFRYEDVLYQPEQNAQEMGLMNSIYLYNKVINEVAELADGSEQDKKILIAQAKGARAWIFFHMINYYGLPYNEASAASDPGFPIIKEADVTTTSFKRATVKEVYDFILKDLTAAIPDLPMALENRKVISGTTAKALLGKVYMFMGKFNEAMPLLNAALESLPGADIPLALYDYNITFGPGGEFLPIGRTGPKYPFNTDNSENLYAKQFTNWWAFMYDEYVISPKTRALFGASDLRLKFYSSTAYSTSDPYPNGLLKRQGPIATQCGMLLPDLYLLNAECKARLNDLAGAKATVEALRIKRMPPADAPVPSAIASNKDGLVKYILEERIREFAVQGFRWFDMRRLSVDPLYKPTVSYTHVLYKEDGSTTSFTLRPERFALRFPQKLMNQNPGMVNNP